MEIRIELSGRVQGVRLRESVRGFANELGLKGFVLNKEGGELLILAQGSEEKLEKLSGWLQNGPGFSKIDSLSFKKCTVNKKYPDFRVVKDKNFIFDQAISFFNLGKFFFGLGKGRAPKHVAIIPDGNRRWATSKGLVGTFGHYKSGTYDNLEELFKEGKNLGIECMSIWGFSTENWSRSEKERQEIFNLIQLGAQRFRKDSKKNKIRFKHIGRKDRLPIKLVKTLDKLEKETAGFGEFVVQLCLDYGGRDEIVRAVNMVLKSGVKNIDEKKFVKYLDTNGSGDPDLIIRTSGEKRLSGFMPFQSVYSELYFSDLHFPDFGSRDLRKAVREYVKRQRRFGGN